jgi:hypothetical protein
VSDAPDIKEITKVLQALCEGTGGQRPNIRRKDSPNTPIYNSFRAPYQELGKYIFLIISQLNAMCNPRGKKDINRKASEIQINTVI